MFRVKLPGRTGIAVSQGDIGGFIRSTRKGEPHNLGPHGILCRCLYVEGKYPCLSQLIDYCLEGLIIQNHTIDLMTKVGPYRKQLLEPLKLQIFEKAGQALSIRI